MNLELLLPLSYTLAALVFLLIYNAPETPAHESEGAPRALHAGSEPAPARRRRRSPATQLQVGGLHLPNLGLLCPTFLASVDSNYLNPTHFLTS